MIRQILCLSHAELTDSKCQSLPINGRANTWCPVTNKDSLKTIQQPHNPFDGWSEVKKAPLYCTQACILLVFSFVLAFPLELKNRILKPRCRWQPTTTWWTCPVGPALPCLYSFPPSHQSARWIIAVTWEVVSRGCATIDLSIWQSATVAWSSYYVANQSTARTRDSIINLSSPAAVLICHFFIDALSLEKVIVF